MRKAALLLVLAMTPMASAETIKPYNLAVGTSVASALAVNIAGASTAGFDAGWDDGKSRGRLLLGWDLPVTRPFGPLTVTTSLELALGQAVYQGEEQPMANLTPLFDWRWPLGPVTAVLETGLGAAYWTRTRLGPDDYSTRFQFSQILGLGAQWGDWQLGGRFQHVSNGGIEKPNNGQNWYGLVLKYHY